MSNTLTPIKNLLNYNYNCNYVNPRDNFPLAEIQRAGIQRLDNSIRVDLNPVEPNQLSVVQDTPITRPGELPLTTQLGGYAELLSIRGSLRQALMHAPIPA